MNANHSKDSMHRTALIVTLGLLFAATFWWRDTAPQELPAARVPTTAGRVIEAFEDWRARATSGEVGLRDETQGAELARLRLAVLEELARRNPVAARARLMASSELDALPEAVRRECEIPWSGQAYLDLRWETHVDEAGVLKCSHQHVVTTPGFSALAYGAHLRDATQPRTQAMLQGYRIGDVVLLEEETALAPDSSSVLADAGGPGGGEPMPPLVVEDGVLDVLFIRVDFSDFAGEAKSISKAALESALNAAGGTIGQYSYGAATMSRTVSQKLYRMPATGASYAVAGNNNGIRDDARALAAVDYTLTNYDVVAVYFPRLAAVTYSQITYSGLAGVARGDMWLNGSTNLEVITHEFGHNYGLFHANYWNPSGSFGGPRFDDPAFGSVEYGDIFDLMGQGPLATGYLNPIATNRLGWLPPEKVLTPTASGTYRIHRFDTPGATANPTLALRVPMGGGVDYWVGHRKSYGPPSNLANAAYVVAEGLHVGRPNLIDMTPGSSPNANADRNDCGLAVGSVLNVPGSGVRFETVASGGTAPNQWIDVNLQFEPRIALLESEVEVGEFDGVARVTLRRTFGNGAPASVNYATANGSATAGSDYLAISGTVTWAADDFSDRVLAIPIRPDSLNEGVETFTFNLSSPAGAVISPGYGSATIRILDPGRRYNGFAPGFFNTTVRAIVPLDDGKVIIAGNIGAGISNTAGIRHIARLNADGTVDPDFLTGLGFNGQVTEMVQQADGKLVVAGDFTSYDGTACNRLIRLNPNGTADTAFVAAYGAGPNAAIRALAVDGSGKILLGGDFTSFSGQSVKRLARLLPTGAPDTATPLVVDATLAATWVDAVVPLPDGKILIGGAVNTTTYAPAPVDGFRSGIARLNPNGSRDASFEVGAGAHAATRYTLSSVTAITRQPDGKLLVGGGFTFWNGDAASRLVRLHANGSRDTSFNAAALDQVPFALAVQPSGTVLVGGIFNTPASRLARLTATGAVDPTWNPGGQPSSVIYAVAEDRAGGLLVGGNFFEYAGQESRPVVRIAGGGGDAYEAWKVAQFSSTQILSGVAGPAADADGDGFNNLLEMAAGTSPTSAGSTPGASGVTTVTVAGQAYLQLEFLKGPDAAGLWIGGQFGNSLAGWSPAAPAPGSNSTYTVIEDSPTRLLLRDNTPISSHPKRFGRIHVKRPE